MKNGVMENKDACPVDNQQYWEEFFPIDMLSRFLTRGGSAAFDRREIAIRTPKFFERNRVYKDISELHSRFKQLKKQKNGISRLEFGPIFPGGTRVGFKSDNFPRLGELCFDIDITDYNNDHKDYGPSSFECSHIVTAPACGECWKTRLEPGRKVLSYLLDEIFGIKHVLWVFSGKKGYHGIVLDKEYCDKIIKQETREFIISQLTNPTSGRVKDHIFEHILWPIFKTQYRNGKRDIPFNLVVNNIKVSNPLPSVQELRIKYIENVYFQKDKQCIEVYWRSIMKAMYWPRLDRAVFVDNGHLLKIPFSLHDSTQNISTPILRPDTFVPENALKFEDVKRQPTILRGYVDHCNDIFDAVYGKEYHSIEIDNNEDVSPDSDMGENTSSTRFAKRNKNNPPIRL